MTRVAVSGAAGRMGGTVCEAVKGAADLELTGRALARARALHVVDSELSITHTADLAAAVVALTTEDPPGDRS